MQPKNVFNVGTEANFEELIDHTHGEVAVLEVTQQSTRRGDDDGRQSFWGLEVPVLVGADVVEFVSLSHNYGCMAIQKSYSIQLVWWKSNTN